MNIRNFECFEDKLAYKLTVSPQEKHRDLVGGLVMAFPTHIARLEEGVDQTNEVVVFGEVPHNAGYPRRFIDAEKDHSLAALHQNKHY